MSFLVALSLSTGICCGIWALLSQIQSLHLITWIGFAGCTAYFASGKHGKEAIITVVFSTYSGVISALIAIFLIGKLSFIPHIDIIFTAIISGTMCLQSYWKKLWFIPGAFIGCFTSFGFLNTGGNLLSMDLVIVLVSLFLGSILALCCDKGGNIIFKYFGKK